MVRAALLALALLLGSAAAERPSTAADQVAEAPPREPPAAGQTVAAAQAQDGGAPASDTSQCLAGIFPRAGADDARAPAGDPPPAPAAGRPDGVGRGEATGAAIGADRVRTSVLDTGDIASGPAPAAEIAAPASAPDDATAPSVVDTGPDLLADAPDAPRRRADGAAHPLPLPRPADAAMRVALRRELRPGQNPPGEDVLPGEKIGQMLMVGFDGDDVDDPGPRRLAAHIRAGHVGGVLFFRRNIASEAAIRRLTKFFADAAAASPGKLPVLLAVDQEGGLVQRLNGSVGFADTPSAAEVAAEGESAAASTYATLAENLAAWGFNLNLGPVVDLGFNDQNPVVTKLGRAYAPDPETVTRFAKLFIAAHKAAGVLTAVKHFPGHGSSNGDTHDGFVDVTETFRPEEMAPFEELIEDGAADMVMVAHVENGDLDPVMRPASLSPVVIEDVLRENCGFGGVVISDDLEMGAIAKLGPPLDVARDAILAGNDILVYGSGQSRAGDLVAVLHARIRVAAEDPVVRARIGESFARIARLKATLGEGR